MGNLFTDSNVLIDNQVSLFTFIYAPAALTHQAGGKFSTVKNNIFIGQSPTFDCVNDLKKEKYFQSAPPMTSFGAGPNYDSKIGLIWSNFLGNKYDKPYKPW